MFDHIPEYYHDNRIEKQPFESMYLLHIKNGDFPACHVGLLEVRVNHVLRNTPEVPKRSQNHGTGRFRSSDLEMLPNFRVKCWFTTGGYIHPGRLTWNLKITQLKRNIIWTKPSFSGSMLIFQGVSLFNVPFFPLNNWHLLCLGAFCRTRCHHGHANW